MAKTKKKELSTEEMTVMVKAIMGNPSSGGKIKAVVWCREQRGWGLKDAKDFVDEVLADEAEQFMSDNSMPAPWEASPNDPNWTLQQRAFKEWVEQWMRLSPARQIEAIHQVRLALEAGE